MGLERRFEKEMRRALGDMMETLYPPGWDTDYPYSEPARIHQAFVNDQRMRDTVSRALQDGADLGVSISIDQLNNIGIGFDYTMAHVAARDWALRYTGDLLNQLGTTSGRLVGQAVGRWFDNDEGLPALIRDLEPVFGQRRAALIAATETTRAAAEGTIAGYQASGLIDRRPRLVPPYDSHPGCRCSLSMSFTDDNEAFYVWRTSNDEAVCKICWPLNGRQV
jgi:hypothetical protein